MPMSIPVEHLDHWMEPQMMTIERDPSDTFCEHCGEEIPWHNNRCRLLKIAYKKRVDKCTFCVEEYEVGSKMYEHTTTVHKDKLKAAGIKLSKEGHEEGDIDGNTG